jgi:hypothetical protein
MSCLQPHSGDMPREIKAVGDGNRREQELRDTDEYYKDMMDKGSRVFQQSDGLRSAL